MTILFKSEEDRVQVLNWYDRFRDRLGVEAESRIVSTKFGESHVLVTGPKDGAPLVVLHGALASSAHVLVELGPLLSRFRVYAVDVIGQSVKSAEVQLSVINNDYGEWLSEVMDGLALSQANVLGVSWGGFVAIRLAVVAPEQIASLSLLVPAGMVKTPMKNNFKVGIPMTMFLMAPNRKRMLRFLATQLTTMEDEEWVEYLGTAFHAYRMNMNVPVIAKPEELERLKAPVFIVAADGDLSFPGRDVLTRAEEVFPNLQKRELIENSLHCPPTTDGFRQWLCKKLVEFVESSSSTV